MLSLRLKQRLIMALLLSVFSVAFATYEAAPETKNPQCSGHRLAALEAANPELECAILLDDDLIFPRNLATLNNHLWLIDKGSNLFSNGKPNGALYRYDFTDEGYARTRVIGGLVDPNDLDIRQHQDGSHWLYFTTRNSVQRFKVTPRVFEPKPEVVIADLPTDGWHKLAAIHLTQHALYLTVPSRTDHCEVDGISRLVEFPCSEELSSEANNSTASIRRYEFKEDTLQTGFITVATGLRDALAVQATPDQSKLIVADNGWDQIDLSDTKLKYTDTPNDEINIIDLSKPEHFGWPYCFNNDSITPPYRRFIKNCDAYTAPAFLLPAHSAPLGMTYFNGQLLVSLHGNNKNGAKVIAFSVTPSGLPTPKTSIKLQWPTQSGKPLARPLGLATLHNEALIISDDWNHQLIKAIFKPSLQQKQE